MVQQESDLGSSPKSGDGGTREKAQTLSGGKTNIAMPKSRMKKWWFY
jgi:hypothetical protein